MRRFRFKRQGVGTSRCSAYFGALRLNRSSVLRVSLLSASSRNDYNSKLVGNSRFPAIKNDRQNYLAVFFYS